MSRLRPFRSRVGVVGAAGMAALTALAGALAIGTKRRRERRDA
ncbi:hypothetical protein [Pauljensenia sp. 20925_1_25]|nr:hypothetical protein [uncultured Actinomyces sp.]